MGQTGYRGDDFSNPTVSVSLRLGFLPPCFISGFDRTTLKGLSTRVPISDFSFSPESAGTAF